jgi:hypothetical protein
MLRIKFRYYALEFVMIFSAVFLGFLADNLRENFADKSRERTFVESLVRNLVSDTVQLQKIIAENMAKADHLDSAVFYKNLTASDTLTTFRFLLHASYGLTHVHLFRSNEATMLQLKNGGFSLLPQSVMDSIADYDTKLQKIYAEEIQYTHNNWRTYETSQEVINYADLQPKNAYRYFNFSSDRTKLLVLHNSIYDMNYSVKGYLDLLKDQLVSARKLISFLNAEYALH